jgi:hypothetical protein
MVGESNFGGPSGRKRAGVGSAVTDTMIVQGVVKPAPGLDFAGKPDVRLGSMLSKKGPAANRLLWGTFLACSRLGALVVLFAVFSVASPDAFATEFNLLSILSQASILPIVSAGLTVCRVFLTRSRTLRTISPREAASTSDTAAT